MDFSGLVKAVREFWDFVWPPIICLTILVVVIRSVAHCTLLSFWEWVARRKPTTEAEVSAYKTLKRFGVDKLLPFAAAFCLLFLMDVARTTVEMVGQALAPTVSYTYETWFLRHSSDEEVRCLWSRYGEPRLGDMQDNIERTLGEEETQNKGSSILAGIHYWAELVGKAHVAFSACTFFLFWALLWRVVEMYRAKTWKPGLRVMAWVVVFVAAGAFFFFRQIWAADQAEFSRVSGAKVFLEQKAAAQKPPETICSEMTMEQQKALDAVIEREGARTTKARWWEIRTFDWYYLRWVGRQITGSQP